MKAYVSKVLYIIIYKIRGQCSKGQDQSFIVKGEQSRWARWNSEAAFLLQSLQHEASPESVRDNTLIVQDVQGREGP